MMMKFSFTAIIFAFLDGVISDECVEIRGSHYQKEVLQDHVESPYQLAVNHNTNTLFYSYTARETQDMFKSAFFDLSTGTSGNIYGIKGGFAHAVDNNNNIVYMGGEDGLYKFDYNTTTANSLHIKGHVDIWQMFYKDGLYFTTFPEERVYFFKNYEFVKVRALENITAMLIAVDINNNLIYFNSSGVYMYERAQGYTVFLSGVVAVGVTSDRFGNILFSTVDGIYYVIAALEKVIRLVNIDDIYGIAVDRNGNIIYATESSIIILKKSEKCPNAKPQQQKKKRQRKSPSLKLATRRTPRIIEINIGD